MNNVRKETFEKVTVVESKESERKEVKTCRYYNKGYCKYENKCRYFHPLKTCKNHLESQKCQVKLCKERHPKVCKWFIKEVGCKRDNCDFLHVTFATDDNNEKAHKKLILNVQEAKAHLKVKVM